MQLDYNFERDWDYNSTPIKPIKCRITFFTQKILDDINEHFHTSYMLKESYIVSNQTYLDIHDYIVSTKSYVGVWS